MSGSGDNESEMPPTGLLDEETIEAIVTGDEVDARFDQIVAFARQVRAVGDEPPPPVSPALEAVFAGRAVPRSRRGRLPGRLATAAAKVAGLGAVAKIGLGTSVAAASVVAAGAGGVLPGPVNEGVRGAIEAVTPVDFGDPGTSDEPADRDDPGRFGDRVSSDATGESDGDPGVDGGEVSEEAPGASHRPSGTGPPENRGLDRAGETPAAPNLPDGAGGPGAADPSGPSNGPEQPEERGEPGRSGESDGGNGTGVSGTPGATAPGATAPGRTVQDPAAPSTPTTTSSAPTSTVGRRNAGGGGSSAASGG